MIHIIEIHPYPSYPIQVFKNQDVMYSLPPHYSPTELNKYAMDLRLCLDRAYSSILAGLRVHGVTTEKAKSALCQIVQWEAFQDR